MIREAAADELSEVIVVQRQAFSRVAAALGIDPEMLPPLQEEVGDLARRIADGCTVLVAVCDDVVIGSVRAERTSSGVAEIGRLVVRTGHEGNGVGTALMRAIEQHYRDVGTFRLFTGADAVETQAFYARRGYQPELQEDVGAYQLVWMTKAVAVRPPQGSKPVS